MVVAQCFCSTLLTITKYTKCKVHLEITLSGQIVSTIWQYCPVLPPAGPAGQCWSFVAIIAARLMDCPNSVSQLGHCLGKLPFVRQLWKFLVSLGVPQVWLFFLHVLNILSKVCQFVEFLTWSTIWCNSSSQGGILGAFMNSYCKHTLSTYSARF